ncbi:UNVERIFIED_CONTAM: hypothetical protein Scaly_1052100 [Sesamum calycinum]|uniref:RNase H type-1 domain-containing protein n=1 Tax=Sesamum calycinum TaxID=2727403 RepID=A0AAW2QKF5_9LAMI
MLDNLMLSLMEDLVASGLVEYPTRSKYSCGVYAIGNPHDLKSPAKEVKHQEVAQQVIMPHHHDIIDKWSPPGIGLLKANFDRAIFSNMRNAWLGVIIRNEISKCVAWRSIRIPHIRQAKLAKALVTRAAMEACVHFDFSGIILEGDCHNIISSLSSNNIEYSTPGYILLDIKTLAYQCNIFGFSHVRRATNSVAHTLARQTIGFEEGVYPPSTIVNIIMVDASINE